MKTIKKLDNQFNISLDQPTADQVRKLADYYNRRAGELLRLLLAPVLRNEWAKMQREEHPENREPLKVAIFKD